MLGRFLKSGERANLFSKVNLSEDVNKYKIIQRFPDSGELKLIGTFLTYETAVATVDTLKSDGLYYYVYGDSNRILYASEEQ